MTMEEALKTRAERYAACSKESLKEDACMDMLRLLNVFTDICTPSMDDIKTMYMLSQAIGKLEHEEKQH